MEILILLWIFGAVVVAGHGAITGREPGESPRRFAFTVTIAAVGWPLWILLLIIGLIWGSVLGN